MLEADDLVDVFGADVEATGEGVVTGAGEAAAAGAGAGVEVLAAAGAESAANQVSTP